MRILHLIDSLGVGGAERSLLQILPRLERTRVSICHLYADDTLRPEFERGGVPVHSLRLPQRYGIPQAVRRVLDLVRIERPDLLHSTLFRADLVGRTVGRLTGIPVVCGLVNDSYAAARWPHLSAIGRAKLRLAQAVDAATARWATHFVAISEAVRVASARDLGIPLDRISVIHRGRDPRAFEPPPAEKLDEARRALGLAPGDRVLLNVARLIFRKGQEELIAAMPDVVRQQPRARLLIAGTGPHRHRLESLIRDHAVEAHVRLLGNRDDVPTLLHLAEVFVFPSHYEGHGGALVEAMLAGCPIVAADTPVHRESIDDGRTGRLVRMRDPVALAKALTAMLRDPGGARALGRAASQTARDRFSIDTIARQHDDFYAALGNRLSEVVDKARPAEVPVG